MLSNYFLNKKTFQEKNLKIVKFSQIKKISKVWVVCYSPLNTVDCSSKFSTVKEFKSNKNQTLFILLNSFFWLEINLFSGGPTGESNPD